MRKSLGNTFYNNQKTYNSYQKNALQRNSSQNYYSYGSIAYNPEHVYEEFETPLKRKVVARPKVKQKNYLLIMIFAVIVIFVNCTLIMTSYAKVQNQRYQNTLLKQELVNLQSENHVKTADIQNQISLDYIETEAVNRLNMSKPQEYQIRYIDVPKESYTVHFSSEADE